MENIIFKEEAGIAEVYINRPKALNALNTQTLKELGSVINEISERKDIHAVIITGSGEKSFVAGADISEMKAKSAIEGREMAILAQKVFSNIENMPQIVYSCSKWLRFRWWM